MVSEIIFSGCCILLYKREEVKAATTFVRYAKQFERAFGVWPFAKDYIQACRSSLYSLKEQIARKEEAYDDTAEINQRLREKWDLAYVFDESLPMDTTINGKKK